MTQSLVRDLEEGLAEVPMLDIHTHLVGGRLGDIYGPRNVFLAGTALFTLASLVVNLGLVALAFWNADRFARWMGMQGLRGISKIVALLLAAIAVSLIRRGWSTPT
jgi:MFS family permease